MEAPTVTKEWLSYSESGEYCGFGKTLLWELIRDGEIEASRVGTGNKRRSIRISRSSLDAYLRRNSTRSAAE